MTGGIAHVRTPYLINRSQVELELGSSYLATLSFLFNHNLLSGISSSPTSKDSVRHNCSRTMAPKNKSSAGLKQGTLSFASAKRGSTAAGKANTLKASPSIASVKAQDGEKREPKPRSASINTTTSESSTDDEVALISSTIEQRSSKRLKTASGQAKSISEVSKGMRKSPKNDLPGEEGIDIKVLEKNPRVQRLYNQTKARMGNVPPGV